MNILLQSEKSLRNPLIDPDNVFTSLFVPSELKHFLIERAIFFNSLHVLIACRIKAVKRDLLLILK